MSTSSDLTGPDTRGTFTFGIRLGLVLIAQSAFISLIAVLVLLGYIANCAINVNTYATRRWSLTSPFHLYFLSLLVSEIFTAIGSIMNLKWVILAGVVESSFCTTQGFLKQLGDVGVALASLAIAFHTFAVLVWHWAPERPVLIATFIVVGIWVFLALNVGISAATHIGETYWGNTQYWCWIKDRYPIQQIVLEYVFLFTAALVNFLLYIPLAAVISGKVVFDGFRPRWAESSTRTRTSSRVNKDAKTVAKQMLFYPVIYTITTLPIAAARFSIFHGDGHVPFGVTVFADVLFSLSGFFNVMLFWYTRRSLLPMRSDEDERRVPHETRNTVTISLQSGDSHHFSSAVQQPESFAVTETDPRNGHLYPSRHEAGSRYTWEKSLQLSTDKSAKDSTSILQSADH